ncbi:MAG: UDP-galactopyranose mutase [Deltaproteobacteria bacterium]
MNVDWLIVGAGLTGCTMAERIACQRDETVLIVEQRDHIAGNAWDEYSEDGILLHKYGPHIFHTNSKKVWDYLSHFTRWRSYFHLVLASVEGNLVPLPFNLNSIEQIFPTAMAERLTHKLVNRYGYESKVPILELRKTKDVDLRFLADYVYKNVFQNYTIKQWGMKPEELLPTVSARVPILISRDNRYFQDIYQGIPSHGYGALVRNMLRHPNIRIMLNTRWQDIRQDVTFKRMVFTGPIDEYFEYKHGELPYRSLYFNLQTLPIAQYQPASQINYPNEYDYTRITEHKLLTGQIHSMTTIIHEYPMTHITGQTVPYYPVPTATNQDIYREYANEAYGLGDKVIFIGRLADYKYYNMDQVVELALAKIETIDGGVNS